MIISSVFSMDLLDNLGNNTAYKEWKVSEELKKIGIKKGDKASIIGSYEDIHWARLAKLHTIAEVPYDKKDEFWSASASVKLQVFEIFKQLGAKITVAKDPPLNALKEGWTNVKDTTYYFHLLQ